MKKDFSTSWNSSKQPRKQRKYLANAPHHLRSKKLGAALDKILRGKYNIRNIEVKKGDEVKIMRGKHKKKTGKISEVKTDRGTVSVEGITNTKKDGTKVPVWIHASKLKITSLNTDDKKRFKRLKQVKPETEDKVSKKPDQVPKDKVEKTKDEPKTKKLKEKK